MLQKNNKEQIRCLQEEVDKVRNCALLLLEHRGTEQEYVVFCGAKRSWSLDLETV